MKKYCVEVCCMQYANAYVEANSPEEAKEKARSLYNNRSLDWYEEEIKQMNVEEEYQ